MGVTFYKWLNEDRTTPYQGKSWPVRAKVWTPEETPKLCKSGWHLATLQGVGEHLRIDGVLWEAEGRGDTAEEWDKVAFASARLIRLVGTCTHQLAVTWACDCAARVLKHFGAKYPDDKRPRQAIAAARRWAEDPTEKNRDAARAARAAAWAAAEGAWAVWDAAGAAKDAAMDAAGAAAGDAWAAMDAAKVAAWGAAKAAAWGAARDPAWGAAGDAARDAEREWQGRRLVELLSVDAMVLEVQ